MIDTRPITHVRFQTPVSIGNVDHTEWSANRPHSTPLAGKIGARSGDPDRGEPRDSIIFECRVGNDHYDVEVPRANISSIIRLPLPTPPAKEGKKP